MTTEDPPPTALDHYLGDEIDPLFIAAARDHLAPFAVAGPVINLGIGHGVWDGWLQESSFEDVSSLDIDDRLVARFSARYPRIQYVCADATTWEPPGRYATIVASHLLEHLADAPAALRLWRERWLAPSGRILVVVPNADSLHRFLGEGMGLLAARTDLNAGDRMLGHHRVYTRALLEAHVSEAGLRASHVATVTVKPLSNAQLAAMPRAYLDACLGLGGGVLGDLGSQIVAVLE